MIDHIKVFDKMVKFTKENPKKAVVIVSTGVLLATIILSTTVPHKAKEIYPYMPAPTPKITEEVKEEVLEKDPYFTTFVVKVALHQIIRQEPRSDGKFVGKIEDNNDNVMLLYINGDYALISYDDNKGNTRIGYVDKNSIANLDSVGLIYQVNHLNMYGVITNDGCRIQNDTYSDASEYNILTRGKSGDYVKVIGEITDNKHRWYVVIYRDYIGYIDTKNLEVMSEEEFLKITNTNYIVIVGNKVRFRNSPKIDNGNIIDEFDKGTKLPIISKDKDWYQVYYNGKYGYVSTKSDCSKEIYENFKAPGLSNLHFDKEGVKGI